jgi:O-antigen/teichoic acid export membrane protein
VREAVTPEGSHLLSGRLLVRNSVWNLIGLGLPLGVAVAVIPVLVGILGTERFGLLALGWSLVGYFSLSDLGLGRALTWSVAQRVATGHLHDLPMLIGTGLGLLAILGVVACAILLFAAPAVTTSHLAVTPDRQDEVRLGLVFLAIGLPVVMLSTALVGVLEGLQRFKAINLVRAPAGALTYLAPLAAVLIVPSLSAATLALVLVRAASAGAYAWAARDVLPRTCAFFRISYVRPLLSFGGWVSVSSTVSPLMVYFDRFLIGAVLPLSAVAYYVTPHELAMRTLILPGAVSAVLFPALTTAIGLAPDRLPRLYRRTVAATVSAMTVPLALMVLVAPEALALWLGPEWSAESAAVLRWLAAGVLVNTAAQVPYALLQAVGRPDLTAKLHVAELPAYGIALVLLLGAFGITGAAAAWTLRTVADTAALFWLGGRIVPSFSAVTRRAVATTLGGMVVLIVGATITDPAWRLGYACLLVAAGAGLGLRIIGVTPRRRWAWMGDVR